MVVVTWVLVGLIHGAAQQVLFGPLTMQTDRYFFVLLVIVSADMRLGMIGGPNEP